ncbi:MAG: hypothetical protein CL868_11055 [Cytophagaceae bacterium]|nr:hypothetical protein [Cytophagaceae bacterium]|tara:strand:- start:11584 stop:12108 length:525 start_codon:yes stop_codon:yes gene_type:complete
MITYIALLRGINVSGQKKIKMAELRKSLEQAGLQDVMTYIQSGNVVFKYALGRDGATSLLRRVIQDDFGFDVPVLIVTADFLKDVVAQKPYNNTGKEYFVFLHDEPSGESLDALNAVDVSPEEYKIVKGCVYLNLPNGMGRAKLNNNLIEGKLKVTATTRNLNTLNVLISMAEA